MIADLHRVETDGLAVRANSMSSGAPGTPDE